ncbi:hypothetical protein [Streptomyces mangrovisoli]|uniref:Uncharacterized protein n=1 Tax=Streptomyces mangrovisoli TaxID=1428628 RepID=A0A1J4NW37_9ACTN|nr:hypothetical protein [Streptomyces mangrovisoli]OIJ65445.1 hypothetical protein WN71_023120 [Streptomyces mangrovisoli]
MRPAVPRHRWRSAVYARRAATDASQPLPDLPHKPRHELPVRRAGAVVHGRVVPVELVGSGREGQAASTVSRCRVDCASQR